MVTHSSRPRSPVNAENAAFPSIPTISNGDELVKPGEMSERREVPASVPSERQSSAPLTES